MSSRSSSRRRVKMAAGDFNRSSFTENEKPQETAEDDSQSPRARKVADRREGADRRTGLDRRFETKLRIERFVAVLLIAIPWVLYTRAVTPNSHSVASQVQAATTIAQSGHVGPWGELICTPISLEPPGDFSSVDDFIHWTGPKWTFKNYTQEQVISLLKAAGLTESQLTGLTFDNIPGGVLCHPGKRLVAALTPEQRIQIYSVLDDFPENESQRTPYSFSRDTLDDILAQSGLQQSTQELLRKALYPRGNSLLLADIGLVMSEIPDHQEKVRLFKILCHRPSMRVELKVNLQTDRDKLMDYWKVGGHTDELSPLLKGLSHVDGGGTIDITQLLPDFARQHIYTFPPPTRNKTIAHRDCHWTSLNFFNAKPDDRFTDPAYVRKAFDTQYAPITDTPRFGDIVMLVTPSNVLIHSAVYLADDIVFTKNGAIFTQPWTYMKLPDLVEYYNTFEPADQPLKVMICRKKSLASS